jgi:signal transduction histidine kinase
MEVMGTPNQSRRIELPWTGEQRAPPRPTAILRRVRAELRSGRLAPYWNVSLLALLYYGAARLGFEFQFAGPVAGIVWLPVGVAISFLALRGLRYWPGALLGDVLSNNYGAVTVAGAIGQTFGNLVEVLLAAYLLQRLTRRESPLESVSGVQWMVGALAVGTLASAIIGPLALVASGPLAAAGFFRVARTWWLGDLSGALIVVPLALAWLKPAPATRHSIRSAAALGVLAFVIGCAWLSTQGGGLTYVAFPALLLAARRYGSKGATLAVAIMAGFTVSATTHDRGPFSYVSITTGIVETQLFIVVSAISTLFLVALVAERVRATDQLNVAELDVVRAEYLERHRIERDIHDGLQQRLLALLLHLEKARDLVDPTSLRGSIAGAREETRTAIDELRDLARGTFPPALAEVGLSGALTALAAMSPTPVYLVELPDTRVDVAAETAAYFVVAEALTNTQKHAHATIVRLQVFAADDGLHIVVVDDGVGGAQEGAGTGIAGLRARVEAFGGALTVDSPAGSGTRITAAIPLP